MDVFTKQIRCILELAAPAWQGSITKSEKQDIERIQKSACHIILGHSYTSYHSALKTLNLESLESRRTRITLKFALKCEKHPKFKSWFIPSTKIVNTRANQNKYRDVLANHTRFANSPLSYITRLLNMHHAKKWKLAMKNPSKWIIVIQMWTRTLSTILMFACCVAYHLENKPIIIIIIIM